MLQQSAENFQQQLGLQDFSQGDAEEPVCDIYSTRNSQFLSKSGTVHIKFTKFIKVAKVHSNGDGISRHRVAPFNAYYLTVNYSRWFPIPVQLKHTF